MYNFVGKRALVTGAGQGIGRALCIKLVECEAKVVALSKTASHLETLKNKVPEIETICVDVGDWTATKKAVEEAGDFDLLVNNAGIGVVQSFLDTDLENLERTMHVNYMAAVNISQVVAKKMIARKEVGSIVNISSIASQKAFLGHTAYSASKAAMDITTKIMAMELGQHKIRVNSVNPTVIFTAMGRANWTDPEKLNPLLSKIPLGRVGEVDEVVNTVLFLLSEQSSFITGVNLQLDGGLNVVGTNVPQASTSK